MKTTAKYQGRAIGAFRIGMVGLFLAVPFARATAQQETGPSVAPTNDLPNPYRTVVGWAKMPEGRTWGSTSAVGIAKDGQSVWVGERCGTNSCVGSDLDPILLFDPSGKLVRSFGKGMITWPHGLHVDVDGNVWVTDARDNRPAPARAGQPETPAPARIYGHQIIKFSPTGEVLLRLGAEGGAKEPGCCWQPNAVTVARNGDIFVAEGHASSPGSTARIVKFDKSGKLLMSWGKFGTGDGEFDQPHALAIDSQNRLFVGDRGNDRILIYSQDGKLLHTWYQFSRASGIFIDKDDTMYVADSESGSIDPSRKAWLRGIRIGSARTGVVTMLIPDPDVDSRNTSPAEGVVVDSRGIIYGAEVGPRALKRYEKP